MGWLGLTGYITFCAGYLRGVGCLGAAGQSYLSLHTGRESSVTRGRRAPARLGLAGPLGFGPLRQWNTARQTPHCCPELHVYPASLRVHVERRFFLFLTGSFVSAFPKTVCVRRVQALQRTPWSVFLQPKDKGYGDRGPHSRYRTQHM